MTTDCHHSGLFSDHISSSKMMEPSLFLIMVGRFLTQLLSVIFLDVFSCWMQDNEVTQTDQHLLHHHRMGLNDPTGGSDLFARLNPGGDLYWTRLFSADKWLTFMHLVSQVIVLFRFVLRNLRETSMGMGIFYVSGAEIKADDGLSHKKLLFP